MMKALLCLFFVCQARAVVALDDPEERNHVRLATSVESQTTALQKLVSLEESKQSVVQKINEHRGRELQSGEKFMLYVAGMSIASFYCGGWSPILHYGCTGGGEFVDIGLIDIHQYSSSSINCQPGRLTRDSTSCFFLDTPDRFDSGEAFGVGFAFVCVGTSNSQLTAEAVAEGQPMACNTRYINAATLITSLFYADENLSTSAANVRCTDGRRESDTNTLGACSQSDACQAYSPSASTCVFALDTARAVVSTVPSSYTIDCSQASDLSGLFGGMPLCAGGVSGAKALQDSGWRGCSSSSPCGECEGDCDNDSECSGSLECFQRTGFRAVPGCSGEGKSSYDYCIDPARRV